MPFPLLGAAAAFAPMLLGGMFQRNDPNEKLRQQLMTLFSPQNVNRQTGQFYNQFLQGPGYAGAQRSIAGGANALQNQLGRNLGSAGLRGSGIGALLPGLASSYSGSQLGGLQTAGYNQARSDAMGAINQQAGVLGQIGPSPNYTQQFFGAGLDFLGPLLRQYLQQRRPGGQNGYQTTFPGNQD